MNIYNIYIYILCKMYIFKYIPNILMLTYILYTEDSKLVNS